MPSVLVANELQNALMNYFYCLPKPVIYAIVLRLIFMGCLLAKGTPAKKFPKIPTDGWLSQHQLGFLFAFIRDITVLKIIHACTQSRAGVPSAFQIPVGETWLNNKSASSCLLLSGVTHHQERCSIRQCQHIKCSPVIVSSILSTSIQSSCLPDSSSEIFAVAITRTGTVGPIHQCQHIKLSPVLIVSHSVNQ